MSNRRKLNLDESRKARAEKRGSGPLFTLGGRDFELPPSPPAAVFVGLGEAQAGGDHSLQSFALAVRMLFGDQADDVLGLGIDKDDLADLLKLYNDEGDDDAGESPASGD